MVSQKEEEIAEHGMVAARHHLTAEAGVEILKKGGNAVDAAVAAGFAAGVVEPASCGLGGGGYMIVYLADAGKAVPLYFHCITSEKATSDMYELEPERGLYGFFPWTAVKDNANWVGHKSAAVPGMVPGFTTVLDKYGTMSLKDVLQPAIRYAKEGYTVDFSFFTSIAASMEVMSGFPETSKIFLRNGRFPPKIVRDRRQGTSDRIVRKDLSRTLEKIAKGGAEAFSKGEIAKTIVSEIEKNGGLMTMEDLASYQPRLFKSRSGTYRDHEIYYAPFGGGTTLIEMLNIMEGFEMAEFGHNKVQSLHVLAEAMRLGYTDRLALMTGDFEKSPVNGLESKEYAKHQRERIDLGKALKAMEPGDPWKYQSDCTTHLSTADKEGNMVALTNTLQGGFGSFVTIRGTGIIMNNAMSMFDTTPGRANSIGPRKAALTNMTPTIALKDGKPYMTVGAPGGRQIQAAVVQVMMNVMDYGMGIQAACDVPRIVREKEEEVYLDSRIPGVVCDGLRAMGHKIVVVERDAHNFAWPCAIVIDPKTGTFHGGVDRFGVRGSEAKAVGY